MFDFLKKKKLDKEIAASINSFQKLTDSDIADIWDIEDRNSFVIAMNSWLCKKCEYGEHMAGLSAPERVFFVTQQLETEVNNGGFSQFFYNSSGDFSHELYDAFSAIGAVKTADICKRAVDAFGRKIPSDRNQREEFLDAYLSEEIEAVLQQCNSDFGEYADDLEELNYLYIISHRNSFG